MKNEPLLPFEQCKQLKELGYHEPVVNYYHPHYGHTVNNYHDDFNRNTWGKGYYSAPTLSQAARWLREVKGLAAWVFPYHNDSTFYHWQSEVCILNPADYIQAGMFVSHDEALLEAIKIAITHLTTPKTI